MHQVSPEHVHAGQQRSATCSTDRNSWLGSSEVRFHFLPSGEKLERSITDAHAPISHGILRRRHGGACTAGSSVFRCSVFCGGVGVAVRADPPLRRDPDQLLSDVDPFDSAVGQTSEVIQLVRVLKMCPCCFGSTYNRTLAVPPSPCPLWLVNRTVFGKC